MGLSGAVERLERSPEFELRTEGGELFFVHKSGDEVLTDGLGAAIWESLPGTTDEIAARVRETLNAPGEMIEGFVRLMRAARVARAAIGDEGAVPAARAAQDIAVPSLGGAVGAARDFGPGRVGEAPGSVRAETDKNAGEKGGRVSVVIVSYNSEADIRDCLDSVRAQTWPDIDVLVVDNASTDGAARIVAEEYAGHGVRLIALKRNLHFARGVNLGIQKSGGEYILVLNADTALEPDSVARLVEKMEAVPQAAAVAPMMKFFNLRGFVNGIGNHVRNHGWGSDNFIGAIDIGQFARLEDVPSACFGAVMLRREALREIGLLDRGYTAYYEDVDWSFRAWFRGWKIVPETRAVVYHKFGASFGGTNGKKMRLVIRNRQRLVLKLFQGQIMLGFFKRYLKEDARGFASALRSGPRNWAMVWGYKLAYASLALSLPGILFKRALVMRNKQTGFREAHVIQKNPVCWTYLDPRGLPQLNAHTYLTYYQREL